jgi:hypothetical protein
MAKIKDGAKILCGKTYCGTRYTIRFVIKNGEIDDIVYGNRINLHIKELIESFRKRKTKYVTDTINLIKLKMINLNEFVSENEQ